MPAALDFYIVEFAERGHWRGNCTTYEPANSRLISAIVRRLAEHRVQHPDFGRVNIVLCPNTPASPRREPSTFSSRWVDVYHQVDPTVFNDLGTTEREHFTTSLIFEVASSLFNEDSPEMAGIRAVHAEFDGLLERKSARFPCRRRATTTYSVEVEYDINWGGTPPFYVAHVTYRGADPDQRPRQQSFELGGCENDLFDLCGKITVSNGDVILTPRPSARTRLQRLKYDLPYRIPIDRMAVVDRE